MILHGVQIDKFKPGTPIQGWIDLSPRAVPFISSQGFNLARVDIDFAGVEPQLGHFDDSYIKQFQTFDHQLAGAGIYHLVNLMQGQYAAEFEGSGFPSWMVITNGVPNVPGPFPQSYLYDPAEERAWDNFWANTPASDGVGLQDHFGQGLRYLAGKLASGPAFLGFDLLNEPWSGSHWPTCANPAGCPLFDQELTAFYRRIIPELRVADPTHLAFYEPHALFDQGANTHLRSVGDPNAVFAFHNYCLGDQPGLPQADPGQDCGIEEQMVLGYADAHAAQSGDSLLEDEWGNTASVPLLQRMANEADQHMIGWSYWAYEDCCSSPGAIVHDATKDPNAPGNLNLPVLQALVRPYPQAVSGIPLSWSFDPATKKFSLGYTTARVAGGRFPDGAQTDIYVPKLQYPHGYHLTLTGAGLLQGGDQQHLHIGACAGSHTIAVALEPGTGQTTSCQFSTPVPPTGCPQAAGRLNGLQLGPLTLGMARARARRAFPRYATRGRRDMDFYCLSPVGIRAGYPDPKLLATLPTNERHRVKDRIVLLLTASRRYDLDGLRPQTSVASAGERFRTWQRYRVGLNTWYLIPNGQSAGVLKVRHGIVQEIGIADKRLTASPASAWRFLTSFR